jgi:hypothetical protein
MAAMGLGCVKTVSRDAGPGATTRIISGRDRCDQRLDPDDVHDPCQITGQDRKCHFSGYFWKRFGEEVCRSHAGLHRAERMLDCLSTLAHGLWVCVEALLHSFEQMFMLPSWNPPLWPCRALGFERTILTGCGPVAPYPLAVFLARKAIWQLLPSRTTIGVCLWQIDKVLLAEAPI